MSSTRIQAQRIRCHGDYHLGQVLWTGKDFVIIDFEGEPAARWPAPAEAPRSGRRGRDDPLVPLRLAGRGHAPQPRPRCVAATRALEPWLTLWYRWVSGTFLRAYLEVAGPERVPARGP